ncbi:NAD-dependent epimerase/dehydratase family protein [Agaribacterium haliotis]|uniref:NAD-dependent epimerase/dehydratase family protein n=1 Tax=Agaribacterium haliotis TaxID=2013869 RepID=UPI000BB53EE9|nr:NAD-dependent epimerase/dehydratase family protein [Agaribacterium haliotis]
MLAVVGGAGFIGSRLCKRLRDSKEDFNILDKASSPVFPDLSENVDVRDLSALSKAMKGCSRIVNLAAEHRDDVSPKSLYREVNVDGAKNICEAARANNVNSIVFTSSVAVYGFAPLGTGEDGEINPFNDYGSTKWEAEKIFRSWQQEDPDSRTLTIIRPTVVFGERNRGNVYNLLKQIASGKFCMIGKGNNRKSMAYVENVAAFIEHSLRFSPGIHTYNYIDKPDFDMNTLVSNCNAKLRGEALIGMRLPKVFGLCVGYAFDLLAFFTRKKFAISSIRVKKFCADSMYSTAVEETGFVPPVKLEDALDKTLQFEFLEDNSTEPVFYSE